MHYALICECMYVWVCVYACALGGGRPLSLYIITSGLKPKLSLFLVSPLLKRPWPSSNLALPLSWELLFPLDFEQLTHKIEVKWNTSSQGYDYLVLMTAVLECYPDVTPSPLTGAGPIVLYSAMMPWSKRIFPAKHWWAWKTYQHFGKLWPAICLSVTGGSRLTPTPSALDSDIQPLSLSLGIPHNFHFGFWDPQPPSPQHRHTSGLFQGCA